MEAVEQAKDSVEQRNQELEKELEYSGSQMQQLEDLISLLEQKEETHMRQLAAMRRQITELLEDNGRLKEEINEKSGRLKNVERSYEETDESLANIKRRYETTKDALELNKSQLTEARNRALLNLGRAEDAEKRAAEAVSQSKVIAEENKVLKRRLERLQERVAELEMLS
jgi:chromosome segregation ATPase